MLFLVCEVNAIACSERRSDKSLLDGEEKPEKERGNLDRDLKYLCLEIHSWLANDKRGLPVLLISRVPLHKRVHASSLLLMQALR